VKWSVQGGSGVNPALYDTRTQTDSAISINAYIPPTPPYTNSAVGFTNATKLSVPWNATNIAYYGPYPNGEVFISDGSGG
jgi:hypothetical protein